MSLHLCRVIFTTYNIELDAFQGCHGNVMEVFLQCHKWKGFLLPTQIDYPFADVSTEWDHHCVSSV